MIYEPGDILLVRDYTGESDLIGNLILAGQRARYGDSDFARWTHCALIVSETGDLVEALEPGIQRTNIAKYADVETLIISPPTATDSARALAVEGALEQVGTKYDVLDFVALALSILTGLKLSLHGTNRYICSGLCSRFTEKYVPAYPLPSEQMMPADIGVYYGALSGEPLPPIDLFGRFLDKFKAFCWAINPFRHGMRP